MSRLRVLLQLRRLPRPAMKDMVEVAGFAAIATGAGQVYGPAMWIVGGLGLVVIGNRP